MSESQPYDFERALLDLLGQPLKKNGDEWNYFNPLAPDGRNADFWVNTESGRYYCFSSDDKGHLTKLFALLF